MTKLKSGHICAYQRRDARIPLLPEQSFHGTISYIHMKRANDGGLIMKKLAVFFPGIGYTVDKPLMHYSRKLAADAGFDVMLLPYAGFPPKVKGDREKMDESYRIALAQSKEMLAGVDLSAYDEILFVGKSIGTVAAAEIAAQSPASDRIRFVLYTPLKATFAFPLGNSVVFTGTADPWVEDCSISELCLQRDIPCHVIPDANHSLETGDVLKDIENLGKIMKKTRKFIRHI
jgi:phosphoglycolate phosphatase